jgi:thymidylate synthase
MSGFFVENGGVQPDADHLLRKVMSDILIAPVSAGVNTGNKKVQEGTNEGLGYSITLENPLDRIVCNDSYKLDLPVAVARFVWMISGNNRLADIKFYHKPVENFSDDGIIVPGSSYGARIRQAFPGIDQLKGVIEKLTADSNSRRAAISIYQPTDSTRESKDIPCAFGMFFHVRSGALHSQIVMRSNNATLLLPFNVFEFSLLGEVIASECGVDIGPLKHYAASMHIYESAKSWAERIANGSGEKKSRPMARMPIEPKPLDQIRTLVEFEAEMRHRSESINDNTISEWIDRVQNDFVVYWQQFALLLLVTVARRKCTESGLAELRAAMSSDLANVVSWETHHTNDGKEEALTGALAILNSGNENIVLFHHTRTSQSLKDLILRREQKTGAQLPTATVFRLQDRFTQDLAARGDDVDISLEDFEAAIADLENK